MAKIIFDSEKELEELLENHFNENDGLCLVTQEHFDIYLRQVNLGSYGIADIVGFQLDGETGYVSAHVIELKKTCIDMKAIAQVSRYKTAVMKMLESMDRDFDVESHVVAPELNMDDTVYLDNTVDVNLHTITCDLIDGVNIISHGGGWYKDGEDFECIKKDLSNKFNKLELDHQKFISSRNDSLKVVE